MSEETMATDNSPADRTQATSHPEHPAVTSPMLRHTLIAFVIAVIVAVVMYVGLLKRQHVVTTPVISSPSYTQDSTASDVPFSRPPLFSRVPRITDTDEDRQGESEGKLPLFPARATRLKRDALLAHERISAL